MVRASTRAAASAVPQVQARDLYETVPYGSPSSPSVVTPQPVYRVGLRSQRVFTQAFDPENATLPNHSLSRPTTDSKAFWASGATKRIKKAK